MKSVFMKSVFGLPLAGFLHQKTAACSRRLFAGSFRSCFRQKAWYFLMQCSQDVLLRSFFPAQVSGNALQQLQHGP